MKVIKHGKMYKEIDCSFCGAKLGYNESDIRVTSNLDDYKEYIKCPECNYIHI